MGWSTVGTGKRVGRWSTILISIFCLISMYGITSILGDISNSFQFLDGVVVEYHLDVVSSVFAVAAAAAASAFALTTDSVEVDVDEIEAQLRGSDCEDTDPDVGLLRRCDCVDANVGLLWRCGCVVADAGLLSRCGCSSFPNPNSSERSPQLSTPLQR